MPNPYHVLSDDKVIRASSFSGIEHQDSSARKRSSTMKRRVQMFDQHAQAEMQHMEKMSET
tara:strand:+ start:631 stop:813 length:183 start_codon:yes stop_codon:yes gene_type:complete